MSIRWDGRSGSKIGKKVRRITGGKVKVKLSSRYRESSGVVSSNKPRRREVIDLLKQAHQLQQPLTVKAEVLSLLRANLELTKMWNRSD